MNEARERPDDEERHRGERVELEHERRGRHQLGLRMVEDDRPTGNEDLKTMTIEELNHMLNEVLDNEDYIRAIAIRDEINSRSKRK